MADQQPKRPLAPWEHNDVDPFASASHKMVEGSGPQQFHFDMRDVDVLLSVQVDEHTWHMLHLQNVRSDTVAEVWGHIDSFLDELKAIDSSNNTSPEREVHLLSELEDNVHKDVVDYILEQKENRHLRFECRHTEYYRELLRKTSNQPRYRIHLCGYEPGVSINFRKTVGMRGGFMFAPRYPGGLLPDDYKF